MFVVMIHHALSYISATKGTTTAAKFLTIFWIFWCYFSSSCTACAWIATSKDSFVF